MEETESSASKKRLFLYLGVFFVFAAFAIFIYYTYYYIPSTAGYKIEIQGNQQLTKKEIREIVLFLIRGQKGGVTTSEIEEALLLNPRIASARVEVARKKHITINIEENKLGYLLSRPGSISEVSPDGKILQESIEGVQKIDQNLPSDMPIFYLTGDQTMEEQLLREKALNKRQGTIRDIISLWRASRQKYSFIWQRIAEIELHLGKRQKLYFYTAHVRARILIASEINQALLQRLWALFYYLEKVKEPAAMIKWYQVELGDENAVIKKVSAGYKL